MSTPPLFIKPVILCKTSPEGTLLTGEYPLDKILNLNAELRKQGLTPIHYHFRFFIDEKGIKVVEGKISADFELICQRCLQPMRYSLNAEILVSPISSDAEAKQLPLQYEPLLMEEGEVNLAEWIAEELHLALPLVPRHETPCIEFDE